MKLCSITITLGKISCTKDCTTYDFCIRDFNFRNSCSWMFSLLKNLLTYNQCSNSLSCLGICKVQLYNVKIWWRDKCLDFLRQNWLRFLLNKWYHRRLDFLVKIFRTKFKFDKMFMMNSFIIATCAFEQHFS